MPSPPCLALWQCGEKGVLPKCSCSGGRQRQGVLQLLMMLMLLRVVAITALLPATVRGASALAGVAHDAN
jgi:hypothetical protein